MKLLKYLNATLATLMLLALSACIAPAPQPDLIDEQQVKQVNSEVAAPQKIIDAALRNARSNWGLGKNAGKIIKTKRAKWSPDCGSTPLALCDVPVFTGWNLTIVDGNKYWHYFVADSIDQVVLLKR